MCQVLFSGFNGNPNEVSTIQEVENIKSQP